MKQLGKYRKLVGIVLGALAAGAGVWLAVYYRSGPPAPETAPGTGPLVSIQRPVLRHNEGDRLAWQIRLKQIQITQGSGVLSAQGIQEALIYGSSGQPLVRVTAQKVTGRAGGSDFSVTGKVTVVSYQGVVISTDTVQWNQSQGQIVCPSTITARSREAMFSTTGMTYDLKGSTLLAPNQVNLYSGQNKIIGKGLNYNLTTGNFALDSIQIIFNAQEAQQMLGGKATP
jgi:lipopolysaccharide export system protein LptA